MNSKTIYFKILILPFLCFAFILAKPFVSNVNAYVIDVHVEGYGSSNIYLGMYSGAGYELVDSTTTNESGFGQFHSKSNLKQGVYFVALPPHSRFELLILEDQNFTVHADIRNLLDGLTIDNLDYEDYFIPMQREIAAITKKQSNLDIQRQFFEYSGEIDSANLNKRKLEALNFEREFVYRKYLELDKDSSFFSKMIRMMLQPDFLEETLALKYSEPGEYYNFYKEHFFDRVDFTDERIVRTPEFVFDRLLKEYCTYFINTYQERPDSAYKNIDMLLSKATVNQVVYKYVLSFVSSIYAGKEFRGMELMFVYIIDNYYEPQNVPWIDERTLITLTQEADWMRFNLVGNTAIDIELKAIDGKDVELHSIESEYTILWFWEPGCKACDDGIAVLDEIYSEIQSYDAELIAISISENRELWIAAVKKIQSEWYNLQDFNHLSYTYYGTNKTPRLFILDANKTIIARDVSVNQVIAYLKYFESKN